MENQTQKGCGPTLIGFITVALIVISPKAMQLAGALSRNSQMNASFEKFVQGSSVKHVQILGATLNGVKISNEPREIYVNFIGANFTVECLSWNPQIEDSAKAAMAQLTTERQIKIEFDVQRTRQGSNWPDVLAYIWADDVLLNEEMIRRGYLFVTDVGRNTKYKERLLQAEAEAKSKQLGVWGAAHCSPPL